MDWKKFEEDMEAAMQNVNSAVSNIDTLTSLDLDDSKIEILPDGRIKVSDSNGTIISSGDIKINGVSVRKALKQRQRKTTTPKTTTQKKHKLIPQSWSDAFKTKMEEEFERVIEGVELPEDDSLIQAIASIRPIIKFLLLLPFRYIKAWICYAYDIKEKDANISDK